MGRLTLAYVKLHRELYQRQIEATDEQIDALVYELYGLTEEEIAIVEEGDHSYNEAHHSTELLSVTSLYRWPQRFKGCAGVFLFAQERFDEEDAVQ